ncbi:hypothetical protein Tco_1311617 [Tanacetum coccineum]
MATKRLDADLQGTPTDQTIYHQMIGGLVYLTISRPDIAFANFVCARYQARPIIKHLKEMQTMQDVKTIAKLKLNMYHCLHVVHKSSGCEHNYWTMDTSTTKSRYFIMAQRQAGVHQDELCPPNKRYALMDANKKIDLDNPLCPNESKILVNILHNHPLRFSIAASSSVPWIYVRQF